ncbi:MAG: DsbA family protein [Geminicoccaceae bacterium]|nr:DsbA family protein [Geminicoccaceae bacterium]
MRLRSPGLALLPLLLLAPAAVRAEEAPSKAAIEATVRDLLRREPELVYQALQTLQERQEAEARTRQTEAVKALKQPLVGDARDPVLGNPEGGVTLVEFFDYRCGYCRSMVPDLERLVDGHEDLRFVMKEFPILGPDSLLGAKAALAAKAQGAYALFHAALMRASRIDDALIEKLARDNGLDLARLKADMDGDAIRTHLQENMVLAQSLGIGGTPAFVLGDRLLPGAVPEEELARLVEAERAGGPAAAPN